MQRSFRIIREYNSSAAEIYKLEKYDSCESTEQLICYFMLLDTHRKPRLTDFPHLNGIITEEDIEADNFIKAFIVSADKLSEELSEQICGIIEELTFHLIAPSLEWNPEFINISNDKCKELLCDRKIMIEFFDELLMRDKCEFSIANVKEEDYNYLSQSVSIRKDNI